VVYALAQTSFKNGHSRVKTIKENLGFKAEKPVQNKWVERRRRDQTQNRGKTSEKVNQEACFRSGNSSPTAPAG